MADGEGKDVYDVLMGMNAQLSRVEAKVDGLVSHERMAEIVNASRREWRDDIRTALAETRHERQNDIQTAVNAAKTELRGEIRQSNGEQDKRMAEREALIEKTAKNVRLQFIGALSALVATVVAIVARYLFTAGG